jgi:hypothetical protein
MKEKLAVEEEKKRKRAEKFGTAKPANGEESVSPLPAIETMTDG